MSGAIFSGRQPTYHDISLGLTLGRSHLLPNFAVGKNAETLADTRSCCLAGGAGQKNQQKRDGDHNFCRASGR
jgi:hypothetical protein